ncbi:competence damage-inducible protein A [Acidilobus saccharovorans 345-15]|uniref:Competence damage-inducible protein A n=1 Tax=Acidilobus saccharovorans (strain DSM 16705 / JCM 18335 / VKM B-2471 / 345-15) TaxID=666510 RepID=D9Q0Q0_ACIS3|nr:nicotinamide mononucleotide deamidase-related protein [Acidilobus saccharovorans]ADL18888.1 competence damage-inducible protein A [Acidilobus saccharovorans 345-15]
MALQQGPKAWLLTIGNEILIGRIVNTNAAWLARKLTFLGFSVERIIVTPDDLEQIGDEIRRALSHGVRLVITTGGLGPTYDDRTLEAVALATNRRLVLNKEAYEMVLAKYSQGGMQMTKEREKMAYMPEGAVALRNSAGTAPGSWLDLGSTIIVSLPGVPKEMEAIFEEEVMPRLKAIAPQLSVVECGFKVVGVPESSLAPFVEEAERKNPGCYVKSHPKGVEVGNPILEIKVLASGNTREEALTKAMSALEAVKVGAQKLGGKISEEGCS